MLDVSSDPQRARLLHELATRYLWWERGRVSELSARRVVAQIMDVGEYDDIERAIDLFGEAVFLDALAHAQAGWFRPRSWSYWHLRLRLRAPGESSPPLPTRSYR